jgi:8-oxo-dGTP diphosphatase
MTDGVVSGAGPWPYKIAVLCDLRDARGRVLLIHRERQPNKGMYSPIGGKLDTGGGESPAQCARREILEEAGIDVPPERIRLVGIISERGYENQTNWLMFWYRVEGPVEIPEREIPEGRLEWHEESALERLPLPRTDREAIWPAVRGHEGGFFVMHIDCSGPEPVWTVEQSDRGVVS